MVGMQAGIWHPGHLFETTISYAKDENNLKLNGSINIKRAFFSLSLSLSKRRRSGSKPVRLTLHYYPVMEIEIAWKIKNTY